MSDPRVHRRRFLQSGTHWLTAAAVTSPFHAWSEQLTQAATQKASAVPPLRPVSDETTGLPLLKLPKGFRYASFGWAGDPLTGEIPTPPLHDGMAAVTTKGDHVLLIRNHEVNFDGPAFGNLDHVYDSHAPAGTTSLLFNSRTGRLEKAWASLGGTSRNCAGGITPWGSWLTCEETVNGPDDVIEIDGESRRLAHAKPHGFVFEVPAWQPASPEPLTAMGRFYHEAVAVDPETGIVYETEDRATAGFYRFIPEHPGELQKGGRLQMMRVQRHPDLRKRVDPQKIYTADWVDINDPLLAHSPGTHDEQGVFHQGKSQNGTTFGRLEGCFAAKGFIYLVSTNGGDAELGQIWAYDPPSDQLRLLFESPNQRTLSMPDNMTVSPTGTIILCEDGTFPRQRLLALNPKGHVFPILENNVVLNGERNHLTGDYRHREWAGCTFSPDGKWLFANLQKPGITFAITGSWKNLL